MTDDPYPSIERWSLASGVLAATVRWMKESGSHETLVLWLGTRAAATYISTALLVRGAGVHESRWALGADPEVLGAITSWARHGGLTLVGDVHAHPPGVPGRLSARDVSHGFQVPEFLAVVAGDGGRDPVEAWGWFCFDRSTRRYRRMPDAERTARVLVNSGYHTIGQADAKGVRIRL